MTFFHSRAARRGAAWLWALALCALPSVAHAQSAGWALDRFDPTPAGDLFFTAEHPWYTGAHRAFALRFGLLGDYARNPLVLRRGDASSGDVRAIVDNMLVAHAQVGVALFDRVGVHLSLPVSLWQSGAREGTTGLAPADGPTVGDFRLGARVRVFGAADRDPISLHVGAQVYLGANLFGVDRASNTTDGGLRARFNLALAGRVSLVRWAFGAGFHLRSEAPAVLDTSLGHDVYANAAVGFVFANDRLTVGPEATVSTVVDNAFAWRHFNAEVLLGAHYLIADTVLVGLGAGPGLTQGAGTPTLRGLLQVAWAPVARAPQAAPPPDSDGDGVLDADDQCPTTPQGDRPDRARRGCPTLDSDGDGVLDPDDQCPNTPHGAHPDSTRRGCPQGDADGDGVLDADDTCREVPRGEHPDPDRAGCPDGDVDRDGVLDHADQCRDVAAGAFPDPARVGCPLPDRDHDTVPDAQDHCPDQAGVPHEDPNRNGCPDAQVSVSDGVIRILRPVYFATNRDTILPRSLPVLRAVARVLQHAQYIRRVRVEGHTDDTNTDAYNLDLSTRRANTVMRWLTDNGIAAERLEAQGFGESSPLQPIAGLTGAALTRARGTNRRVVFVIVDPASAPAAQGGAR